MAVTSLALPHGCDKVVGVDSMAADVAEDAGLAGASRR